MMMCTMRMVAMTLVASGLLVGSAWAEQTWITRRLQKVPRIARGPGHGPHARAHLRLDAGCHGVLERAGPSVDRGS
jgi:hypothetical protein